MYEWYYMLGSCLSKMNKLSKTIEKLRKSVLAKVDDGNVYDLRDRNKRPTVQSPVKPKVDLRSRNDKIADAMNAQGKVDDHFIQGKGEFFSQGGRYSSDYQEPKVSAREQFDQRVKEGQGLAEIRDEKNAIHEAQLKALVNVHGKAGEYAAPFYKKLLEAHEAGYRGEKSPDVGTHNESVPGMPRKVTSLGESPNGHMFAVSGNGRGEREHLFEVSGNGKNLVFTRYPALLDKWEVKGYGEKLPSPSDINRNANQAEADSAKFAHLALKTLKYSKAFKEKFPESGKYTDFGEFHPKDFKAELKSNGWGHEKLTDTLGYSYDTLHVKGKNKSGMAFGIINPRTFENGQAQIGMKMPHPAYISLPNSRMNKEEAKKIFETVMKDPKIAKLFPHGYKFVNDPKEATDDIRKLQFRIVKSLKFIDILRKSAMSNKFNEIPGGEAAGKTPKDFTPSEQEAIKVGTKIENEEHGHHGTEISMDHVAELGDTYYKKLKEMERSIRGKLAKDKLEKAAKPAIHSEFHDAPVPPSYGTISNLAPEEAADLAKRHGQTAMKYASSGDKASAAYHHEQASKYWKHGQMHKTDDQAIPPTPVVGGYNSSKPAVMQKAVGVGSVTPRVPVPNKAPMTKNVTVGSHIRQGNVITTDGFAKQGLQKAAPRPNSKDSNSDFNLTDKEHAPIGTGGGAGMSGWGVGGSGATQGAAAITSDMGQGPKTNTGSNGTYVPAPSTQRPAAKKPTYPLLTPPDKIMGKTEKTLEEGLEKATGDIYDKALQAHSKTGGSTFCFQKGDLSGQPLFAVSPHKDREQVLDHPLTKQDIQAFHSKNKDLFGQEGHVLGTWFDPSTKKSFLDVTMVTPDQKHAIELGKKNNQKAIFDLKNMKTLRLDKSIPIPPPMVKSETVSSNDLRPVSGSKQSSNLKTHGDSHDDDEKHTTETEQKNMGSAEDLLAGDKPSKKVMAKSADINTSSKDMVSSKDLRQVTGTTQSDNLKTHVDSNDDNHKDTTTAAQKDMGPAMDLLAGSKPSKKVMENIKRAAVKVN